MSSAVSPTDGSVLTDRYTKGGRRLWYKLTVLQQPERARACGSGSKSANDRRPVDPPPVVELRVFEGPSFEGSKDITFHHNASFFLFVTLEHARVIAHGRVQQPHNDNQPPVLTGSPVSGMAYLDRPSEAGYFLFPDLSVRHEGNYRLVFQLYEQPKEKADYDVDQDDLHDSDEGPFCHRSDIKSNEFSVYSAKKFPGLAESTSLSRMVAEQGCRVRIRRDVRMRRRDGKPGGGDFDKPEDEYARTRRTSQTPEMHRDLYRARSGSAASDHRTPYSGEPQRRTSGVEPYPPPPPYVASQPAPHSNLRFGDDGAPQFSPHYPPHHGSQLPPVSPTTSYHGNHQSPYPPSQPPQSPYAPTQQPQSPYPPSQQSQVQTQPPPPPPSHYNSRPASQSSYTISSPIKAEAPSERRISGTYAPQSPAHPLPSPAETKRPSIPSPSYPPPPPSSHNVNYPLPAQPPAALPSLSSLLNSTAPPPPPPSGPKLEAAPLESGLTQPRAGEKRSFDDTFMQNPRPLFNGSRPLDPHHGDVRILDGPVRPGSPLWYRRADGTWGNKMESQYIH
jgi:hypothetical protein